MRRRRFSSTEVALPDAETSELRARRRRPGRRRRLALAMLALAALLLFGPTIVAKTALRDLVLSRALPAGAGRVVCRDASFSWTGGQALAGVAVIDPSGAPLVGVELVRCNRSIIGLLSDPDDLGMLQLTRPVIQLDARDGGSNLEDLLHKIADAAGSPDSPAESQASLGKKSIEIVVTGGVVHGRDLASGQQWRIDSLDATAKRTPHAACWDVAAEGILTLAAAQRPAGVDPTSQPAADAPGRFKLHLGAAQAGIEHAPPTAPPANPSAPVQLELMADRLPLAPVEPWLARVLPAARITGDASADLQVSWIAAPGSAPESASPVQNAQPFDGAASRAGGAADSGAVTAAAAAPANRLAVTGKLNGADVRFTSAALAGDLVEFPAIALAVDATLNAGRLSARQLSLRSEWLQAELAGEVDLAELPDLALESLPSSDVSLTARAELPQLARMLPRTLRLRPGVQVEAGNMEIAARSSSGDAGRRWTMAASLQNLVGSDGQRPIHWTKPVEVAIDAADSPAGPQFQRGLWRSAFATASVDGSPDGGFEGELQFDLDELSAQLGQFVDLSAWKLAGAGQGQFSWRDAGGDRFAASAELELKAIDVQREGRVVWRDPQLQLTVHATGVRTAYQPQRIETASLAMRSPADALAAELLQPVELGDVNRSWLVKLSGAGPLELWAGRLRPWFAAIPEQLAGQSKISAQVRAGPGLLQVAESQASIENFVAQVGDRTVEEPRIEAAGDFRWDRSARALQSQNLEMTSSTVAGRARGVSIQWADNGPPTVRGEVALRGDLERLAAWQDVLVPRSEPRGSIPRGQAVGRLLLTSDAQRATVNLSLKSEPFQLVSVADGSLAWNDPQLELTSEASYSHGDDRLQLATVKLTGKTLQLHAHGVVEQLRTAGLVRGEVDVAYDAAEFAALLATYLGPGVQIHGANTMRLQASGRLFAASDLPVPYSSPGGLGSGAGPAAVPTPPPIDSQAAAITWNASTTTTSNLPPTSSIQYPASSLQLPTSPNASPLAPHWSRRWQLATETGWSSASLYGLAIGAARVTATVRDGMVQFTPLELAVGPAGRVSLQPRVLLDSQPQRLQLAPGPAVSNVAISADVSERMLKYAAPILAGATRAEGSFSFFLHSADIPLRQPKQGRLEGRLTIHQLAVTPGPLIQDVANLVRQIEAVGKGSSPGLGAGLGQGLLGLNILGGGDQQPPAVKGVTMSERAVDVRVVDGRVYHQNLEFLIDDVPVRSSGSVGFDETLALTIEVPVQEKWVGNRPALKALVGQPLQIPIGGTFSHPQVDPRAIANFAAQAAQQAAGGVLGEEINKALDKILKPR
ncbi:MAG: hypothetical protein IT424_07410 [Pirellulales bacterium]|nr:hypothetical protein [Pirellulales bacterium]